MATRKPEDFVHLHVHADTSLLDGFGTIPEMVQETLNIGQKALAVTDHGNMHGVYDLYTHATNAGIKPIAGIEAYMAPSTVNRKHKSATYFTAEGGRGDVSGRGAYTHITLLAENNTGLHNLYKMGLLSYTEGFFQKNRIDLELLAEHGEGIIATTGCPSGEIQTRLRLGQKQEAYTFAGKLQDALGKNNVFVELMDHAMTSDLERGVRNELLEMAQKLNMPLVATNDVHYTTQQQAHSHEEFLCVQTRSVMSTPPDHKGGTRFAFEGNSYYLKTAQEMADIFPDHPEALNNTLLIAERSNIIIEPDPNLRPKLDIPDGLDENQHIHREAIQGLQRRLPEKAQNEKYLNRLEKELSILKMKDYVGYFLVVSDFVRWAKNNQIPTGYGRGCLSGDSQILTPQGFKALRNIQPGDTVFDEKGHQVAIPNKMEYNCDEQLIHIKSHYGGNGNKMTADHKVLISKANPETNKSKLSKGNRYKKELNPVEWVRADEVKRGDYVVIPKLKFEKTTEGWKIEKTSTSVANHKDGRVSRNSLSRETGLSRGAVSRFLNGEKVTKTTETILTNTIAKHGITVEKILKTNSPTVSETKTDYIEPTYDAGVLFGLFISDGWIQSNGRAAVGFAQRRSEDEGYIPTIINKVFGITPTHQNHKTSDLRQYYINHKGIHKLFQTLFPDYQFTATTKYIPEEFYTTPEEFRKGLLEGLWYGDGSHVGKTKYSTRSLRLAQGVHTLLLSLGLPAGIKATQRHETRKGYGAAETTEYSVTTAAHFNTENPNPSVTFRTDENFIYYRVRETQTVPPEEKVYDFTVPTTNSYTTDSYIVHNSAGGSLVAYCLDITDIDPLKYDLLFERFINPERDSPPDIDMDFNDTDREKVIQYVKQKYGDNKVAQIATFGKIGAKAAIKDSIRIKELPYTTGETLSKALPDPISGKAITLKEVYNPEADRYPEAGEFRDLVKKIDAEKVIETAKNFEGRTRSTGVHAAALVISSKPVVDSVPMMQRQNDGAMITQWDYPTCEHLGLLKVDFLGLRNLGVVGNTLKHIQKTRGENINLETIISSDMDNPKTYQLLAKGDSNGVFQLDSCLSGDTLVSGRKIKELYTNYKKGEGIQTTYSIDLSTGKRVRNKILRFVESGIKPVYRLVSESGRMVEATEDHKFMTDSGWKRLGDIDINVDKVLVDQTVKTLTVDNTSQPTLHKNTPTQIPKTTRWETIQNITYVNKQMTYDISMKAPLNNFLANGFMVHNSGMQSLMKQLKPTDFNDVSALIALYRPGPMGIGAHVDYALRKNGEQESTPIHPELKDALGEILGDTHQIIVYQEQIMLIAQKVANYTLAQADNLRRAMGKKKKSVLDAEYVPFSEGMRKNGYSEEAIKDLWNVLVPFADYGFNKCVSDKTVIRMADGSARSIREVYNMFNRGEEVYVQSMWADGEVKPHRVANVVSTGMKEVYRLKTKNGRTVDLTPEHRLLTTRGYLELQNIVVGEDELIVADKVDGGESVTGRRFSGDRLGFVSSYGSDKTRMAEFLIENNIDFEMHKPVGKGECDFYFEGLYWEMDGMDRHVSYFKNKYGDIPFVVVTPEDYQERIADVLNLEHVRNGDVVVSVEKINRKLPTIDIEMAEDGPKNFLTWKGIVSHNSHSVGYGMLSYLTAYLKANYPAEFMSSLLSSVSDDTDKTALYLNDCRSMGITVDPPNVNESNIDYEPASADHIHFGFKAIRGVGEGVAAEIVAARGDVPFKDFNDFVARVPKGVANKRILEALALGGAFDVLGVSRRSVVHFVPDLLKDLTKIHRKAAKSDDVSLFDLTAEFNVLVPDVGEWGKLEKLKKERHALGLYVSGHPLEGLDMATAGGVKVSDLTGGVIPPMQGWIPRDAKPLKLAGIVTSLSKKRTKKGETFALGTVEDLTGTIPFVMFPKAFKDFGEFLELDGVYQLSGFHRERDIDGISFAVDALRPLEFSETGKLSFRVKLTEKQYAAAKHVLLEKLAKHKATGVGSTNVIVSLKSDAGDVWEEVLDITVKASPVLSQEVREVFGMLSIGRWRKS